MEPKKNLLKKISSKYIFKLILSHIFYKKQLIIFQHSKEFQKILGINIFSYQKLYIFNSVHFKITEDKIELDYSNVLDILEEKGIKDTNKQKEILTKYFLDIYNEYSKNICINIDKYISYNQFLILASIKAPIKIKLILEFDTEDKNTLMQILDNKDKINIIECEIYYEEDDNTDFLKKLNELNKLEEISFPCELISDLVDNNYKKIFKNNLKIFEVVASYENKLINFCSTFEKIKSILNRNKNLDTLRFKNNDEYPEKNNEAEINLNNMINIRKLELNGLHIYCQMNKKFSNNLTDLYINYSYIYDKDKIQFLNLKKLCIEDIRLYKLSIDYSSLLNLEYLSVKLLYYKDYTYLLKILNSTVNLIELEIYISFDGIYEDSDSSRGYIDSDSNEDSNDYYDYDDWFKKFLKVYSKKIIDRISKLNNLKSLVIINNRDISRNKIYISDFLTIFHQYKFKKLNNLKINCLNLNEINIFLNNNPGIENIDIEISDSYSIQLKNKEKEKDFRFVETDKIQMKQLLLNFDFDQKGYFHINTSTLQIIKLKNLFICNSSFKIFIDKKISFNNLTEFELKNKSDNSEKKEKQNVLMKFVQNFNNYKKLKKITIIDLCVDRNFANEFIKNNNLVFLTKFKLCASGKHDGKTDDLTNYFKNLYPYLKLIDKVRINIKNEDAKMKMDD